MSLVRAVRIVPQSQAHCARERLGRYQAVMMVSLTCWSLQTALPLIDLREQVANFAQPSSPPTVAMVP